MLTGAYPAIKAVHASCAMLTLLLFVWRGRLLMQQREISVRWLRRVPDTVDTLLLLSGVLLVLITRQYPFVAGWLTVKLFAVVAYIALGFVAFRFARNRRQRLTAWTAALGVFSLIVWLAVTRQIPG
jgi:uncharacterized membrane protein SirB2